VATVGTTLAVKRRVRCTADLDAQRVRRFGRRQKPRPLGGQRTSWPRSGRGDHCPAFVCRAAHSVLRAEPQRSVRRSSDKHSEHRGVGLKPLTTAFLLRDPPIHHPQPVERFKRRTDGDPTTDPGRIVRAPPAVCPQPIPKYFAETDAPETCIATRRSRRKCDPAHTLFREMSTGLGRPRPPPPVWCAPSHRDPIRSH
jgi:hypothetical protein